MGYVEGEAKPHTLIHPHSPSFAPFILTFKKLLTFNLLTFKNLLTFNLLTFKKLLTFNLFTFNLTILSISPYLLLVR